MQHALVDPQARADERAIVHVSTRRQRRSGRSGVSALQCGSGSTASASAKLAQARCPLGDALAHSAANSASISTPAASSRRSRSNALKSEPLGDAVDRGRRGQRLTRGSVELRARLGVVGAAQPRFRRANSATSRRWFASVQSARVPGAFMDHHPLVQERAAASPSGR